MFLKEDFKSVVRESLGETAADVLLRSLGSLQGFSDTSSDGHPGSSPGSSTDGFSDSFSDSFPGLHSDGSLHCSSETSPDNCADSPADSPVTSVRLNPLKRPLRDRAGIHGLNHALIHALNRSANHNAAHDAIQDAAVQDTVHDAVHDADVRDSAIHNAIHSGSYTAINTQESSDDAAPQLYTEEIPWAPDGFYLDRRINFTLDPLLHGGAYYVQDASSMFPALLKDIIGQSEPERVLDLCAAPGGKSTHLISLLSSSKTSVPLIAVNEPVRKRVPPLTDNIARWGASNVLVTSRFAKDFQALGDGFFDLVLADVPCSGEGMFRKSAEAVEGWSLSAVHECARLQREIISDIWPVLSDGGLLIYSTCTYNHFENADNVRFIASELGADVLSLPESLTEKVPGLLKIGTGEGTGYQFVPGLVRGEGQFFALLRKVSGKGNGCSASPISSPISSEATLQIISPISSKTTSRTNTGGTGAKGKKAAKFTNAKISNAKSSNAKSSNGELKLSGPLSAGHRFYLRENRIYAVPSAIADNMIRTASLLNAVMCGVCVGELKGRDLVPDADLALSCMVYDLLGGGSGERRAALPESGAKPTYKSICGPTTKATAGPANRPSASASRGIISEFSNGAVLQFYVADADRETALKFLARQSISPDALSSPDCEGCGREKCEAGLPKGYILVTYEGFPLGFVKNLGNRCNNLHPNGRRILHL